MNRGFTLIELILATGIFSMVALVGFGVLGTTQAVQTKTKALREVNETARFSLETMAREIRLANGLLTFDAQGQPSVQIPAFTILTSGGTDAPADPLDGRVVGTRLRVIATDVVTRQSTIHLIELQETAGTDGTTQKSVVMSTCTDSTCGTVVQTASLVPPTLIVNNLEFRGLLPQDPPPLRQPFVQIDLSVQTNSPTGRVEEQASQTVRTVVTSRGYTL